MARDVVTFLRDLFGRRRCEPAARLSIVVGPVVAQERKVEAMDVLKLTNEQQVLLRVRALTAHGRDARVDGDPIFVSSDSSVVVVKPSPDGDPFKALAVALAVGHAQVSVAVDAELGDGVRTITGALEIDVIAAGAALLSIGAGAPEDQPVDVAGIVAGQASVEDAAPPAPEPPAASTSAPADTPAPTGAVVDAGPVADAAPPAGETSGS